MLEPQILIEQGQVKLPTPDSWHSNPLNPEICCYADYLEKMAAERERYIQSTARLKHALLNLQDQCQHPFNSIGQSSEFLGVCLHCGKHL